MSSNKSTRHGEIRMAQRAIREDDLELILRIGTEVENGYFVCEKDAQVEMRRLKMKLEQIRRISGKRVVVAGDRIVTVYHAYRSKTRSLLRYAEQRR